MDDIQMSPKPSDLPIASSDLPIASPPTKRQKSSAFKDADSLPLLEMVIEFRSRNGGANPTPTNLKPLYDLAKSTLLSAVNDFTPEQLYNRIRHLRFKYHKLLQSGPTDRDSNRSFLELSARAWGEQSKKTSTVGALVPKKMAEEEEDHDAEADNDGDSFECLNRNAKEYWRAMQLNEGDLEMGLKSMDREKAKAVEAKWIQHSEAGLKIQAKKCKLDRELFSALLSAQKGTKRNQ